MKFLHISDLHIGKKLKDISLIDDQRYILNQIIDIAKNNKVDTVLIAGDIYDKSIPSAEAVALFDSFLTNISKEKLKVIIISGNHDSAERIAFGSDIMKNSGVYFSPVYNGEISEVVLNDEHGDISVYMLPFVKPAHVRQFYPDENISSYNDAVKVAISKMDIDTNRRNILMAHQFVTGAERSESEDISVGGLDNIDVSAFSQFDYVALGHIHKPQYVGRETVRYCGTPLKYSFSEANHSKGALIVTIGEKLKAPADSDIKFEFIPFVPIRDLREIKGEYSKVVSRDFYKNSNVEDFVKITLTDEDEILDALSKLRSIYPNIVEMSYDNKRTRQNQVLNELTDLESKRPIDLIAGFYENRNNQAMTGEQHEYMISKIDEIWEGQK